MHLQLLIGFYCCVSGGSVSVGRRLGVSSMVGPKFDHPEPGPKRGAHGSEFDEILCFWLRFWPRSHFSRSRGDPPHRVGLSKSGSMAKVGESTSESRPSPTELGAPLLGPKSSRSIFAPVVDDPSSSTPYAWRVTHRDTQRSQQLLAPPEFRRCAPTYVKMLISPPPPHSRSCFSALRCAGLAAGLPAVSLRCGGAPAVNGSDFRPGSQALPRAGQARGQRRCGRRRATHRHRRHRRRLHHGLASAVARGTQVHAQGGGRRRDRDDVLGRDDGCVRLSRPDVGGR